MARCCPFCGSDQNQSLGKRNRIEYVRCLPCRSIYAAINEEEFQRLHDTAWEEQIFLERLVDEHGITPRWKVFNETKRFFTGKKILEIGAGTGHLLAAYKHCGYQVTAVEPCAHHAKYIRQTWDIPCYSFMENLPKNSKYDGIIVCNVLEHIYDLYTFINQIQQYMSDIGVIYISSPNAHSVMIDLAGMYWSTFKPLDHISIPSRNGLHRLAGRTHLAIKKIYYREKPFETPVSLLVSLRDYINETRHKTNDSLPEKKENVAVQITNRPQIKKISQLRKICHNISKYGGIIDPSSRLFSLFGKAATIKALIMKENAPLA